MTGPLFQGAVAIDTNVFIHLLNPQNNPDGHINRLLTHLSYEGAELLVDDGGRIAGEYNHLLGAAISGQDDRNEIYILRYWILNAPRRSVEVSGNDVLMTAIRRVIVEPSEAVDRVFVYVALKVGKILISNDEMHIVIGPLRESGQPARRARMLRRFATAGAEILTSWEAHARIQQ